VRLRAFVMVFLTATALVAVPQAAGASGTTYSTGFSRSKTWYSAPLHRYFKITMTGTLTATVWSEPAGHFFEYYFGKPHIKSPVMKVAVYRDSAMRHAVALHRLELSQYYYDRSCKTKPSFSASVSTSKALSIGVSVTTECNTFQTAYRQSTYGSSSHYSQYTSGSDVVWKNKKVSWPQSPLGNKKASHTICVTGEFEMQPYLNQSTDDLLKFRFSDICLKKTLTT